MLRKKGEKKRHLRIDSGEWKRTPKRVKELRMQLRKRSEKQTYSGIEREKSKREKRKRLKKNE